MKNTKYKYCYAINEFNNKSRPKFKTLLNIVLHNNKSISFIAKYPRDDSKIIDCDYNTSHQCYIHDVCLFNKYETEKRLKSLSRRNNSNNITLDKKIKL